MALTLPEPPKSWTPNEAPKITASISGFPQTGSIEPVGPFFQAIARRARHNRTESEDERVQKAAIAKAQENKSAAESTPNAHLFDVDDKAMEDFLLDQDPAEWRSKPIDMYKVMGLSKLRWRATLEDIKFAYSKKVLLYHPDKRGGPSGADEEDDDLFKVIKKAFEILTDKNWRSAFDSIDPFYDDAVPAVNEKNKKNFYAVFGPVFERNAHFSTTYSETAPYKIGTEESTEEEVNATYNWWYSFNSWREYQWLDEEDKKQENRDERRWNDKENKAERKRRKAAEVARMLQLVDNAMACDPRIARFRAAEAHRKGAKKREKEEAARLAKEEADRVKEEARIAAETAAALAKETAAEAKKKRDWEKQQLKNQRKRLRNTAKANQYFLSADDEANPAQLEAGIARIEQLCEKLGYEALDAVSSSLIDMVASGATHEALAAELESALTSLGKAQHDAKVAADAAKASAGSEAASSSSKTTAEVSAAPWTYEEKQLLVKAVKVHPAGTNDRWAVIVQYLHEHLPGRPADAKARSEKDARNMYKELQSMGDLSKEEREKVNSEAFAAFERKKHTRDNAEPESAPTQRIEADSSVGELQTPWSADEQKVLEAAIRTVDSSAPDRWALIAAKVPGRSADACQHRFKELAAAVKAKKAADAKK